MTAVNHLPSPEEMRELVHPLDELDRKVVGGLVALWMHEPQRVRDREWTAQQFVQLATVAHGFDAEHGPATSDDVERVRDYALRRMSAVLHVGLALFVRLAEDLRTAGRPFGRDEAQAALRAYLAADVGERGERDAE